ncbi:hydantoinase/oxoprolinase N-terminal domain-containing protein [Mycobacteroides abscessus]|uniref:hydantoinase/oxoprolinase N-terminal domain-containing protein n=1 Tax=Mycobacteroides abscessus TaxID=36809 RepID=UPI0009271938|nr:hydantoinase/oxoprolinase N-terminal domain-containing protein [Mycobacteroides abscessus]SHQ39974.1 5-oxoprolinase [Mycobacteroides abscessus subsp. abscessus]
MSALLSDTERFVLGSTIVTNAVDELRLSRVGLLTISGFEDTLRIARSARGGTADTHRIVPYPTIAQRRDIRGVDERIDSEGRVITPLDPQQVRPVAAELIDGGVAAIAVCPLWVTAQRGSRRGRSRGSRRALSRRAVLDPSRESSHTAGQALSVPAGIGVAAAGQRAGRWPRTAMALCGGRAVGVTACG